MKQLITCAEEARNRAYAPYSSYHVGAAVRGKSGKIYTGCNVENASYGATICAERNAIWKAVSEGEKEIVALAVVGGPADGQRTFAFPCGMCRQVLREFSDPERVQIYVAKNTSEYKVYTLAELLPDSFGPDILLT